jgi:hypothetical protein
MKKAFTLVELIVAFFLMSLVVSVLFTQMRMILISQHHIQKVLNKTLQTEKNYLNLHYFFERLSVSATRPMILSPEKGRLSFYYFTSLDDPFEISKQHYGILAFENNQLVLKTYVSDETPLKALDERILLSSLSSCEINFISNKPFQFKLTKIPEFIEITSKDLERAYSWVYNTELILPFSAATPSAI